MGNEWPVVRLGNYVDACLGKMLDKEKNKGRPHKYLGNKSVRWGSFDLDNLSEMLFEEREHERYEIKSGDLIICEGGEPGRCAIWKEDVPNMKIQKALHRVRAKKGLENLYLYYWFLCSGRNGSLEQYFTGTTIKHFTGKALSSVEIPLPPVSIQKRIGRLLSSLDNKIQLNRETNKTLEAMAQALFKSWFVDFDPVIDNALAAGNDIPEPLQARAAARKARAAESSSASTAAQNNPTALAGLPKAQRELFPSEFEETEALGWVPKGWGVVELSEITTELRRGISPKYLDEGGVAVINQKCIRNHEINYSLARRNNPASRKIDGRELILGDVLINSTGVGTLGRIAQVNYLPEVTVVDSHVTVVRPKYMIYPSYAFGRMMLSMENYIESLGEGSTGQTELSRKMVSELKVFIPNIEALDLADKKLKVLSEKSIMNLKEREVLTKLRDTLLPKLISGELRLPGAEKQAKASD